MVLLELFNLLHFIGLAWGVGGATVAAIISRKAEKNPEIGHAVMKILPAISKLIWAGLILLIISGIGVSAYVKWPLDMNMLIIKHVVVVLIVVIGVIIGFKIKKMAALAPKPKGEPSPQFLKTKKQVKNAGIINLILWYIVVVLAVLV